MLAAYSESERRKIYTTTICAMCGQVLQRRLSDQKKRVNSFCSKPCHNAFMRKGCEIPCYWCGVLFYRPPSMLRKRNFCSNTCRCKWFSWYDTNIMNMPGHSAGHKAPHLTILNQQRRNSNRPPRKISPKTGLALSEYNRIRNATDNPMWNPDTVNKVRSALLDRGKQKTYRKYHGRHEHRVIAERILGRPLSKDEVVHHIDGNKRNNSPENLMVLPSQAAHASIHFSKKGGDA